MCYGVCTGAVLHVMESGALQGKEERIKFGFVLANTIEFVVESHEEMVSVAGGFRGVM